MLYEDNIARVETPPGKVRAISSIADAYCFLQLNRLHRETSFHDETISSW